jgi:hypothetical protein
MIIEIWFNLPAFCLHHDLPVRPTILARLAHVSLDPLQPVKTIPHHRYHLPNQIVAKAERVVLC